MGAYRKLLGFTGGVTLAFAVFQAVIVFSPSLSLYFSAPESLVANMVALVLVGFGVAGILTVFGLYALSGGGYIRALPWVKPMLVIISVVYTLRGLLLIPEALVVMGFLESSIPIAPRFVVLSLGSLLMGLVCIAGTRAGWHSLPPNGNGVPQ